MVLCVKYRKQLLYDEDKIEFIKFICSEIGQRYSIVFDTIGTDGDHVHVFVGAAPQYSSIENYADYKKHTSQRIVQALP